jgi:hypothetical protein
MGTGGSFVEVKRPRHEADHTPLTSDDVKKMWTFPTVGGLMKEDVIFYSRVFLEYKLAPCSLGLFDSQNREGSYEPTGCCEEGIIFPDSVEG